MNTAASGSVSVFSLNRFRVFSSGNSAKIGSFAGSAASLAVKKVIALTQVAALKNFSR